MAMLWSNPCLLVNELDVVLHVSRDYVGRLADIWVHSSTLLGDLGPNSAALLGCLG